MNKNIIFYGAGQNARDKSDIWMQNGLVPVCFADEDSQKWHTTFNLSLIHILTLPTNSLV